MNSRDSFAFFVGMEDAPRRGDLHKLTSTRTSMQTSSPPTSGGRARFDQGSKRRDEYGRLNMGGDYVNNGRRGINARALASDLDNKSQIGMKPMGSTTTLKLSLRLAQARLALNDKYAQLAIIQDNKSQLTFRSLDQFKKDGNEHCMHISPTVENMQMVPLERAIDITKSLAEEV